MRQDRHEALWIAASRLAGEAVVALAPAGHGANSRVFRVDLATRRLALKSYPERRGDPRDRLETEWAALQFLSRHGVRAVPAPIARDSEGRLMLMEWIDGEVVSAHGRGDVDDVISFIVRVFELSREPGAPHFDNASEACLSANEILRQIDARLATFDRDPMLESFLEQDLHPALAAARARAAQGPSWTGVLPPELRRLIPADLGFHNALRQADGRLRYIDFDYFGWDDPVKLTADFLVHPAMRLSESDKARFKQGMAGALADDREFCARLDRHLPLYCIRWALILLNCFRRDRRSTVPADRAARQELWSAQLEKARAMTALAASHAGSGAPRSDPRP
jgi:Phosphotransferase enzyme family